MTKQKKQEFNAEDLESLKPALPSLAKPTEFNPEDLNEPPSNTLSMQISELRDEIDSLQKKMHDKGLEVGLPTILLFDISEIMGSLSRLSHVMVSDELKEKWKKEDEEIKKKLRDGNEIPAFFEKERQAEELRTTLYKISGWLDEVVNKLGRLEARIRGKDIHDYQKPW